MAAVPEAGCYCGKQGKKWAMGEGNGLRRLVEVGPEGVKVIERDPLGADIVEREVELAAFLSKLREDVATPILPVGTRYMIRRGNCSIFVVEEAPRKRRIRWESLILSVSLALPYVVFVVAVQETGPRTKRVVDLRAFFRNSPLISPDDKLYRCNLPNTHPDGHYCWVETTEIVGEHYSLPGLVEAAIQLYWEGYFRDFTSLTGTFLVNIFIGWWLMSKIRPAWVLRVKWRVPQEGYRTVREAVESVLRAVQGAGGDPSDGAAFDHMLDTIYRVRERDHVQIVP